MLQCVCRGKLFLRSPLDPQLKPTTEGKHSTGTLVDGIVIILFCIVLCFNFVNEGSVRNYSHRTCLKKLIIGEEGRLTQRDNTDPCP